ncbi:MAG TPA: molecular chaperone HtpG [Spirochaetia bacterium]|nr:molecular chaperone HtpG [Spirochaetia bacterium]
MAKHQFQAEVNQLLTLIIHSLYSHPEIFLRELVSNASDALDKLKYLTLTQDEYKGMPFAPRIDILYDTKDRKTLTVTDSGIGMNDTDLEENLGTIARSGTREFIQAMAGDAAKGTSLIGQFGVGFYSAFMVADRVEVVTRKVGDEKAWKWTSDGKGEFDIAEAERDGAGTTVTLFLNDAGREFADRWRIEEIIRKYSNHIAFPIHLHYQEEGQHGGKVDKVSQVNSALALWRRPKGDLKEEDYKEFYKTLTHDDEEPLLWIHLSVEGALAYSTLFYIPKRAPFDLFRYDYQPGVKLYIKRVFITDSEKELLPVYLRFVRGIIDSEDLPLNVSREILQKNRVMENIRSSSVRKILQELEHLAKDKTRYGEFWNEFGRVVKEGVVQDSEHRDQLLELLRFKTTGSTGWTSLAEYRDRMQKDQKAIYYITGVREASLRDSPLLETYKNRGLEVLVMDDEIDEIVSGAVGSYLETPLKAVNRSSTADDLKSEQDVGREAAIEPLVKKVKKALGDLVKDVRASHRLADSPSCVVVDENDPTVQMQQILKLMGNRDFPDFKPILEINPSHPIVTSLAGVEDEDVIADASRLLLDQALLIEGAEIKDPAGFVKRLNRTLEKSLKKG